ncbi:MAG TPA: DUF5060 domain-containing protein [Anditalea sp.]|nr:DUF5060 domain-containing protein [Anditalea sp.]
MKYKRNLISIEIKFLFYIITTLFISNLNNEQPVRIKVYLLHFFIILFPFFSHGQIINTSIAGGNIPTVQRYQVHDFIFRNTAENTINPFDVVFGAIYTGPSGEKLKVPGFYNGDEEWVSRFSATEVGTWTFETYASLATLSGHKGSIEITKNSLPNQKGAVVLDPENPQAFVYGNGSPYFLLAYELDWLFALDYGNASGLPRTDKILDEVASNGFNHIVMNVYAYDVAWRIADNVPDEYFFGRPEYGIFHGGNENPDFSQLNLTLFQHLDRVIDAMKQKGLDAHLMIYVWNKMVNWPEMYSKADNMYFDYVIDRYQAFSNVIWDISKEALDYGRCDIPYLHERISRVRGRDAFKRLLTVHDYEYNSRHEDKVDFISIQSWRPNLYSLMLQGRQFHIKPVVNIETWRV